MKAVGYDTLHWNQFPLNVDYEGKIIDEKSSWSSYTVDTMAADDLAMKVPRLSWNIFGSAAEGLSDIVKDFSDVFEYKLTCLPIFTMWMNTWLFI